MAIDNTAPDLAVELQKIYDSEIDLRIGWLWDGGIEIRLEVDMNGMEVSQKDEHTRKPSDKKGPPRVGSYAPVVKVSLA